jgi:hypothetical protein
MKSRITFLFFLPLLFLLSGCFEIIEEVNINPDGSGTLVLTFNGNQSKDQLDKALTKDSIYNVKIPKRKDIDAAIQEVSNKLKSVKGISNVEITRDYNTYILVIKCSFANTTALNSAINNIWLLYDKKTPTDRKYFSYTQNTYKRIFDHTLLKHAKAKLGAQERDILSKSNYTCIYRFQTEIISSSNKQATLSKSKKAIILKNNILDIVTGNKSIENDIKLK